MCYSRRPTTNFENLSKSFAFSDLSFLRVVEVGNVLRTSRVKILLFYLFSLFWAQGHRLISQGPMLK